MTIARGTRNEHIYIDLNYLNREDCIQALNGAFDRVPKMYRDKAYFNIDYGIVYPRNETDEEFNKRVAEHKLRESRRIEVTKKLLGIK